MTASAALLAGAVAQRGLPGLLLSAAGVAIGAGLARHAYRVRHDGGAHDSGHVGGTQDAQRVATPATGALEIR